MVKTINFSFIKSLTASSSLVPGGSACGIRKQSQFLCFHVFSNFFRGYFKINPCSSTINKVTPPVKTRAVLQSGISDVLQDMWHFWMPFHECSYFILLCAWVCIMTHTQIYIYILCVCVCELELFHVFVQPYACLKK